MSESALFAAEAQLLVQVANATVSHPDKLSQVISPLIPLSTSHQLSLINPSNLLRLLLVFTSPVSVKYPEIAELSAAILHAEHDTDISDNDLIEDIENLSIWLANEFDESVNYPEDAIVQTAKDLQVSLAAQSHQFAFNCSEVSGDPSVDLFSFIKAKSLQLGSYYDNIMEFAKSLSAVADYAPFSAWLNGLIVPYNYYHQYYALPSDLSSPAAKFLSLEKYSDQFEFLIAPLASSEESLASKLSPQAYLSNVALPLAVYHENDLSPLSQWLVKTHSGCDSVADFQFWDQLLKTVLKFHSHTNEPLPIESYDGLVRLYVSACLYYGVHKSENMKPLTQANIQTQIRDTLAFLVDCFGEAKSAGFSGAANLQESSSNSLEAFVECPPVAVQSIMAADLKTCVNSTLQIFETCFSLYLVNDLTVRKFFDLKAQANSNSDWFHKEVAQILARSSTQSYDHILQSLAVFSESFLSQNPDALAKVDQLVFESLLSSENFDRAIEFLGTLPDERRIPPELTFQLVKSKFWDLFENASNLDDRIGKLRLATNCLDILDQISQTGDLSEFRATVVKIKHLLKAIHSLKNFKLVLVRNQPVTPKQVLDRVTGAGTQDKYPQFSIISSVLEQNPKSYLAHERLHKIVNDLTLFGGSDDAELSVVSFSRVQSACVESALIDSNFEFAYKQTKALISHYVDSQNTDIFSDIWLMFYQVGKYISSEWFGDYDASVQDERISVLLRQREILTLAIKYTKPNAFTTDNSQLLVGQFRHVNREISKWHEEANLHRSDEVQDAFQATQQQIQENISGLVNEAVHSKNQASEKLSNLFVSGLGWAIGAKR